MGGGPEAIEVLVDKMRREGEYEPIPVMDGAIIGGKFIGLPNRISFCRGRNDGRYCVGHVARSVHTKRCIALCRRYTERTLSTMGKMRLLP